MPKKQVKKVENEPEEIEIKQEIEEVEEVQDNNKPKKKL